MRKAHLRFRNGDVVAVELTQRHQVRAVSNRYETPSPLIEWPHELRWTRPRLDDRVFLVPLSDTPTRITDDVATFRIDRETFDPDRHWQNYIEVD